jgi:hypothetical protein
MTQFDALKNDIKMNGQLVPITLYRGKLVDGRHRLRALKEISALTVDCVSLPNNLTLQEVKSKVLSTEIRRHQSPTQLAIKAYRLWKASDITQEVALTSTGASRTNLKLVNNIVKMGRLDIIDLLEMGGKVNTDVSHNYERPTDSLSAIVKYLKVIADRAVYEEKEFEEDAVEVETINTSPYYDTWTSMLTHLSKEEKIMCRDRLNRELDENI